MLHDDDDTTEDVWWHEKKLERNLSRGKLKKSHIESSLAAPLIVKEIELGQVNFSFIK